MIVVIGVVYRSEAVKKMLASTQLRLSKMIKLPKYADFRKDSRYVSKQLSRPCHRLDYICSFKTTYGHCMGFLITDLASKFY